jgi:hypothetical protein
MEPAVKPDFVVAVDSNTGNINNLSKEQVQQEQQIEQEQQVEQDRLEQERLEQRLEQQERLEVEQEQEEEQKQTPLLKNTSTTYNNMVSETVEIEQPQNIIPHLMPQEQKWWHFKFRHITDEQLFTRAMEEIGINTVTYNYTNKNAPDVSLINNGTLLGKIHFLHMNRPDVKDKSKYYVKLYLFYFSSKEMFDKVKNAVIVFFDTVRSHPSHTKYTKYTKHTNHKQHPSHTKHTQHTKHNRTHTHRRKHTYKHKPHVKKNYTQYKRLYTRHSKRHPKRYPKRHTRKLYKN